MDEKRVAAGAVLLAVGLAMCTLSAGYAVTYRVWRISASGFVQASTAIVMVIGVLALSVGLMLLSPVSSDHELNSYYVAFKIKGDL